MKLSLQVGIVIVSILTATFAFCAAPDLRLDGNIQLKKLDTDSGPQQFAINSGLLEGANFTKVVGANRPTTLWSDSRRAECYEYSIRLMAQMPTAAGVGNAKYAQEVLQKFGLGTKAVGNLAKALDALDTNYVSGETLTGEISNEISQALRKLNPKTVDGVPVSCSNLKQLGDAMQKLGLAYKVTDFAIGAAVQEALAGDLALGRLQLIEDMVKARQRAGVSVDPAIFTAIKQARLNLVRSEDYWGALVTEVSDRSSEVYKLAVDAGVKAVQNDAVWLLTKHYGRSMGAKAAAAKASTVAGLWAFSLLATYETIDALLDQHKRAQISVCSATMAFILKEELKKTSLPDPRVIAAMELQAEYSYYDHMVKACTGLMPEFYDLFKPGQPYKDAKEHFTGLREKTKEILLQLPLRSSTFQMRLVAGQSTQSTNLPPGLELMKYTEIDRKTGWKRETPFIVEQKVLIDHQFIANAEIIKDDVMGDPFLVIILNPRGVKLFSEITRNNINRQVAIIVNGKILCTPIIRGEVKNGKIPIPILGIPNEDVALEEARLLAASLKAAGSIN